MVNSAVVSGGSNLPAVCTYLSLVAVVAESPVSGTLRSMKWCQGNFANVLRSTFEVNNVMVVPSESQRLETLRRRNGEKVNSK